MGRFVEGINLKSSDKMCEPDTKSFLRKYLGKDISVRIIAGEAFGVKAPTQTKTPTTFYHFKKPPNKKLQQKIDSSNSFAYIFKKATLEKMRRIASHSTLIQSRQERWFTRR